MNVAVIGGGISGIATAYYLRQRNIEVDLYEEESRIGGRIGSEPLLKRQVDFGGKNIGKHYRRFREFAQAFGNPGYEYFGLNTSQVINGTKVRISRDDSKLLNLIRIATIARPQGLAKLYHQAKAILDDRSQGFLGSDFFMKIAEHHDDKDLGRYFNRSCVDHIVRPMTIRMNGAEPDECYPGNFGSNLSLALDSYEQLNDGMHGLLVTFKARQGTGPIRIHEGHKVTRLGRETGQRVHIEYTHDGNAGNAVYDHVISAIPAHRLAELLDETTPKAAAYLRKISYYPVAVAIVKYRSPVFTKKCRAMVFDHKSALSNAGAYGINDLDMVRYTFSGRVARATVSEFSAPEAVVGLGEETAAAHFNIQKNQRAAVAYRYMKEGLCAYSPRHHLLLASIDRELDTFPGLSATGDYRRGASIEACFNAAAECVDKLTRG